MMGQEEDKELAPSQTTATTTNINSNKPGVSSSRPGVD
jgi:hypothetical protein